MPQIGGGVENDSALPAMPEYRLYYLDGADHILSAENFNAADDAAAIAEAHARCDRHLVCHAAELWQGSRRVDYYRRAAPP